MLDNKLTGIAVPLGALYTKDNPVIGEFADLVPLANFCKKAGIKIIQLLPLNDTGTQSSPYSGLSAYALHPIYIRIKDIPVFKDVYKIDDKFTKAYDNFIKDNKYTLRYSYDSISTAKTALLQKLFEHTDIYESGSADEELSKFIKSNPWIKNYAVYKNLKWNYMQASWKFWHEDDQHKTKEEIDSLWNKKAFKKEHLFYAWCQMVAFTQLEEAVKTVHEQGIILKGDMPILMNEDSCDAWAYPEYFNQNLRAGSPQDGENPKGQNWGFPTYNWKNLKTDKYEWWINRLKIAEKFYDAYRLDHILGFFRIWAIPSADCNALNGHTEPFVAIKKDQLKELGFDENRIRWLSQPHIPTSAVEDITWNHTTAYTILNKLCTKLDGEELWLFKKNLSGSQAIYDCDFESFVTREAEFRIKDKLVEYWSNRTLLEITKNKYVPMWTYFQSTSWASLNGEEKEKLTKLFTTVGKESEKAWKKQSEDILGTLTKSVKMIPCGEDLGVAISCVPEVMNKYNILGLRVVRWNRIWSDYGQPYIPFEKIDNLSVTTTSVHDSSTIRQWWDTEKDSIKAFIFANPQEFNITETEESSIWNKADELAKQPFEPDTAEKILKACSRTNSKWLINPLQDFLYMNKEYWLEKAEDERINIPGTVSMFNWTYRLPVDIETLSKDDVLINKIKNIAQR